MYSSTFVKRQIRTTAGRQGVQLQTQDVGVPGLEMYSNMTDTLEHEYVNWKLS